MATGTFAWYGSAFVKAFNAEIDFDTDTIKMALASSSYTPDADAHDYWNDVSANEVTGTNWSAGGVTLASKSISIDGSNNRVRLFAADISVNTVTVTDGKYSIFYKDTGTPSTSPLLGYITWDTALAPTAGTLAVDLDGTNGFARVTY